MFRTPKVTAIGKGPSHRATENGIGTETASNCCSQSLQNSRGIDFSLTKIGFFSHAEIEN
jgi:hypothetical protein